MNRFTFALAASCLFVACATGKAAEDSDDEGDDTSQTGGSAGASTAGHATAGAAGKSTTGGSAGQTAGGAATNGGEGGSAGNSAAGAIDGGAGGDVAGMTSAGGNTDLGGAPDMGGNANVGGSTAAGNPDVAGAGGTPDQGGSGGSVMMEAGSGGTGGTVTMAGGTSGSGGSVMTSGGSGGGDDLGGFGGAATGPCGTVVINELATDSDFIELYNVGSCPQMLEGWNIFYIDASGGAQAMALWTGTSDDEIAEGGFWLIAGPGYKGSSDGNFNLSMGINNSGGGIGLYVQNGTKPIDSVAWKNLTKTNKDTEGSPAPNVPSKKSISRLPDGTDTNDNSIDFHVTPPTPGAANQLVHEQREAEFGFVSE